VSNDSSLFLHKLSDETIEAVVSMPEDEQDKYFYQLVSRFYKDSEAEKKKELVDSYRASFILEYMYRTTPDIQDNFIMVYTQTGLIREITNSLYFLDEEFNFQIN
jgi:hypothetical protein